MENALNLTDQYAQPVYGRDEHAKLVGMFEEAEDASYRNRSLAERDIDYYDGKQWTEAEVKKLRKRGQAALMDNHIKPKIRYLQGLEQSQRTDPKGLPRTEQHERDANSVTDALMFVVQDNRFNKVRSKTWKNMLSAGWGGNEIVLEQVPGQQNAKVVIRSCQWDRMFWDPHSSEDDFSDAGYLGMVLWMDRDDAVRRYGDGAGKVFDETVQMCAVGGTYDDKPKLLTWVSNYQRRPRVRVVQMYYLDADGVWCFSEFTKGGYLNGGVSPWLDDNGEPEHPYAWNSANVDRDNNRYGEIRHLIDLQDGINHRQSKFQHLISVRQTFGTEAAKGSMTDRERREQLAKADGHVTLPPQAKWGEDFGIIPTGDMADAQFALLQQNIQAINVQGPNAAMQGKDPRSQSGRALLAQQQGGSIEASPVLDNLRDMDYQTYCKAWRRVRQGWQAEQWVRVTDDADNVKWVGFNVPKRDPLGQPIADPMTGQPALENVVSQMMVDIIISDAPPVGTMQDEEFGKMVELAKFVPGLQSLGADDWIEMSNLRNKSKVLRMLQQKAEQESQPDPLAIAAAQSDLENQAADTYQKRTAGMKNEAQAQATLAGAQLDLLPALAPPAQPNNVIPFNSPAQQPGF